MNYIKHGIKIGNLMNETRNSHKRIDLCAFQMYFMKKFIRKLNYKLNN